MVNSVGAVGGSQGMPSIDPQILAELQKYGLKPQGSKEADLAAIESAKAKEKSSQAKNQGNLFDSLLNEGEKPPIDQKILSQLQELGLKPQGSKEADLAAIQQALQEQHNQLFMDW